MTEKDLGLKAQSRRLLWRMGFSTRVDVPLRAFVPGKATERRSRYESFTDLDVLGLTVVPGFAIRKVIADCKTSARGSTERMFWIRGVADFFAADDAWMVRSSGVTAAARQLSARLRISVLEPADVATLEGYHPSELGLDQSSISFLFEPRSVEHYMRSFSSLDKRLSKLLDYRPFNYWVFDDHRALQQLVAHLAAGADVLNPNHPVHRALFLDCVWLYTLAVANAAARVRAAHVTDIDTALQEYIFGGQVGLQEKQQLAALLERFAGRRANTAEGDGVLPPWYRQLLELVTRHLRRPGVVNDELRYAEWMCEAQLAKREEAVATAFGNCFTPVAAKLLADVCGFLVSVAGLDQDFRTHARAVLSQPGEDQRGTPPAAVETSPRGEDTASKASSEVRAGNPAHKSVQEQLLEPPEGS